MRSSLIIGGIAVALAGCATNGGDGYETASDNVCLSDYQITSFSPVDDTYLYVEGVGNRHYLFTMERGCFGLRTANTIGIRDRIGQICSNSADEVIYRDIARGPERCRILDIEEVASREDAGMIAEQREELRRKDD